MVESLRNPDFVSRSSRDPATVRICIKWIEGSLVGDKWMRVVVKRAANNDSYVLTAFVRSRADVGDVIWQKENP